MQTTFDTSRDILLVVNWYILQLKLKVFDAILFE